MRARIEAALYIGACVLFVVFVLASVLAIPGALVLVGYWATH